MLPSWKSLTPISMTKLMLHESSIVVARERAKQAGVADQTRFEVATPRALASSQEKFDLVCFMDSLHDMGDPLEAVWASRQAMAPSGALMLIEPFAKDRAEENVGPVAMRYYSASAGFCTQNARRKEDAIHWERRPAPPSCLQSSRTRGSGPRRWRWKLRST